MKQHYILENTYLEKEDYEALKRYCSENLKFLDKKDFISNSGNLYIDSVVNYKADMAEKAGIKVSQYGSAAGCGDECRGYQHLSGQSIG